ncbi:MAG: UDP-N-acetylglucosamine--N-acetylmuramyl-(pentapeptide) pyrophosphoryl-undecaprenol N-acetylglucosamine transferase [Candidatus Omnitrophica bacterium]|nr:UDP-N-acetylglucosamine--N-acetylmuramyl-(pentapeptide) pyrophosphoryl-undecaprenol N-acetylglucosamine transferase [Candidatus Omnitrophota bacterium]
MKILIACGASGGHIFPAISFAERLKAERPQARILFVVSKTAFGSAIPGGYDTRVISVLPPARFFSARFFCFLFSLARAFFESISIIRKFDPVLVVGFGCYSCVPAVLAAVILRKKTLLHEQNVIPGRALRLLAPFVNKIAISFQETRDRFGFLYRKKIVLTGNPLRGELFGKSRDDALSFFGFDPGKKTILVMGGSQGSRKINKAFISAAAPLKDHLSMQVIHICGRDDREYLAGEYKRLGVDARVFDFLKDMGYAYSLADAVVSRAGAMAVSEIIGLGKPSVLIPYPFARAHQSANAEVLSSAGAAIVIKDVELSAEYLRGRLLLLLREQEEIDRIKRGLSGLAVLEADKLLVNSALELSH